MINNKPINFDNSIKDEANYPIINYYCHDPIKFNRFFNYIKYNNIQNLGHPSNSIN